eukprot:42915-Hanusia_phi.AAC.1
MHPSLSVQVPVIPTHATQKEIKRGDTTPVELYSLRKSASDHWKLRMRHGGRRHGGRRHGGRLGCGMAGGISRTASPGKQFDPILV